MIRKARPDDLEAIWALEQDAFEPERRVSKRSLQRSLSSPGQRVLVAGEPLLGFVTVWLFPRTARIYDIAVARTAQGQGIGESLLDAALAVGRRHGAARMVLEAHAQDKRLVAWYEKRGFAVTGVREGYYAPGHDAVRMERPL